MDEDTNYIISGLERSGTSLVMQILKAGGFPILYDNTRKPDKNNPNGYYELYGGKVIKHLLDKKFEPYEYRGIAVKITSYGLPLLPKGDYKYKIIYTERDVEEVFKSQQKMIHNKFKPSIKDFQMIKVLTRLNNVTKQALSIRPDIEYLCVCHRNFFTNPREEIEKISEFVGGIDIDKAINVIDESLYRNKV